MEEALDLSFDRLLMMMMMMTVELHVFGLWLSGSARLFGKICREFYKTNLSGNYRLSDQAQYSVMASRIANQAWSKDLDAGTWYLVTAELQDANVDYFQGKIQLSGFSPCPGGSPSQLIRISGVLLCMNIPLTLVCSA